MSDQKGLGSKLLGLFVETGDERPGDEGGAAEGGGEKTAAELVAELAGQSAPAGKRPAAAPGKGAAPAGKGMPASDELPPGPKVDKVPTTPPPAAGAPMDFESVFKSAGMDAVELDRVKKAEDLLKSLPEETPLPVKKQIVEASLKAFGFEIAKIVQAAQNQKRALDTYVRVNESATAKAIQDAEAQIRALNEKIAALRGDIEKRTSGLTALNYSAQARKAEVQKVIDFFQGPQAPNPPAAG